MDMMIAAMPLFLLSIGLFFLIRLRGFYLFHPVRCFRAAAGERGENGVSPGRALTVALAGTLGVGNIVGVASALYSGGAGAIVWMLISTFAAMVLKYAEIVLAMRHRKRGPDGQPVGGAPYYIRDGLTARGHPGAGRFLAGVFAFLCLVNAVTMGSVLQVNAAAGAMRESFHVPPLVTGAVLAFVCVSVLRGGAQRIARWTERLVPLMTVLFLGGCAAVLCLRAERIPAACASMIRDAFRPGAAAGGIGGFGLSRALRYGVMRGLISNEAGSGTAPMAHAVADTKRPAAQGILGIVEVFVDTVLLCTVTSLTILVSDSGPLAYGEDAVRTARAAFSSVLGDGAGYLFALCILCFGGATVLCWAHYGLTCARFLLPRHDRLARGGFSVLFGLSLLFGAVSAPAAAWRAADGAIALMTCLNLGILLYMHREIAEETAGLYGPRPSAGDPAERKGD